ncbi:heparinase II/III domain-containing protein [Adhaeribacter soli]|uniref:DUF4962 domain-containing protein n=1 Tax=Adhaeribacter soli TaxID=2607655 RepID=A0A5N1J7M6_9BACT|nr:heparinase II/III family protein [Adhaeribacter soli]KAA9340721.1 DUF4962 domain-containing protein [Adhaeribacter soli]
MGPSCIRFAGFISLLLSILNLPLAKAQAMEKEADIKAPENILKTLRQEHPRLLATGKDFAGLKSRLQTDPILKAWHRKLQKKGDQLLDTAPCRYDLSEKNHLLDVSREVVKRVYILSMLYQLQGKEIYKDRAWQELEAAANFPDWNPDHFLDVGEMTHAFAIGYDWLYPALTEQQRTVLRTAIIRKGLNEAMKAYQGKALYKRTSWIKAVHNWNQVCNSGIGMGALAIADEEPALANEILGKVIAALPYAMVQFGPDGAWDEGPGYWAYATRYNVIFIAGLETALGNDFGLSKIEGFSRTALFPLYMNGPTNKVFNYADGTDEVVNGYQLFWLANRFQLPAAAAFQLESVKSPHPLDLLWYNANLKTTPQELSLAAYFRHAEVVTMRSAWNDPKAWFVGFKAGNNKANHSHLDLGSFVLDAFGKRWAVDLGKENYALPEYFDSGKKTGNKNATRWTYYRTRAEGHNTLVLNPNQEPDQDPFASTRIEKFQAKENTALAIADLTPAYAANASSVRRGIALLEGQGVLVQDEIKTQKPATLYWFMHTPANVTVQLDGRSALLTMDNEQLEVVILSPAKARFNVMPATPLPGTPRPEGINKNEKIRKLSIQLDQVQEAQIAVIFRPAGQKDSPVAGFYKALDKWKLN